VGLPGTVIKKIEVSLLSDQKMISRIYTPRGWATLQGGDRDASNYPV